VLTGLTSREDISSKDPPSFVFDNLSCLMAFDKEIYSYR